MYKYILRRLLLLIPVVIGVSFVVYGIMSMVPGDPVYQVLSEDATPEQIAATRHEMGLDQPFLVRYGRYMLGLLRGNMGKSYISKRAVFDTYMQRFPATLKLGVASIIFAVALAIPLGVLSATHQNGFLDTLSSVISLLGVSMPNFWLGLLLILFFSQRLGWFPSGGNKKAVSLVLPAITEGAFLSALIMRTTRSSMLEVIRQDYIVTAKSKGVSRWGAIIKHGLKNALIPIVTATGMNFAYVLGGPALTETVFSWPGVGRLIVDSMNERDIPMVTGCLVLSTLVVSIVNLIVDIAYAYLDPRIKARYTK